MTDPQSEARALLLQAAADGELDAAGMIEVEAQLAADPALAAQYARLVALREAIAARAPRPRAPDALRARVMAMVEAPERRPAVAPHRRPAPLSTYARLAASLVLGIALGAGSLALLAPPTGGGDVERAIVAGFVRGRLAGEPVDVATSDRHTVKPWFAGKIAGATTVVDLKAEGFPLIGGRVDVVGATPVATLIYQRREHQIALSEMPASGAGTSAEPRRSTREGYAIVEWTDGGRLFAAVSDLPPAALDAFAAAFRRAAAAEREDPPKP
jgi:anti-sigma factor RsiW